MYPTQIGQPPYCFAYAVAKNHRAILLFKGDDFAKTDIRPATTLR